MYISNMDVGPDSYHNNPTLTDQNLKLKIQFPKNKANQHIVQKRGESVTRFPVSHKHSYPLFIGLV